MRYIRFLIFPLWYLAMSCATQTTPQGGPKDTIPPTVVKYHPEENAKNFKGKQITIEFDEAIQLNNPKEEVLIIPSTGKKTEFKLKGYSLIITPELPWRDSTTYNINFREGVKDLTEGNPAKDLRGGEPRDLHLAFSTGPFIDTLSISGSVKNAYDEKIPDDITIAVYTSDTFDIFEDIPDYFTKSDKQGNFSLTNLKQGKYRIYAFADKNKNLKTESRSEKFGFIADTIRLDSVVRGLQISVLNIDTRKPKLNSRRAQSNANIIRFSKSMVDYEFITDYPIVSSFSNNQTEIIAYYPEIQGDSLLVGVKAIDSTQQTIDTLIYLKRDPNPRIKDKFKVTPGPATYNIETNILNYTLSYNKPIISINNDSVYLRYDTATVFPIKYRSLAVDSLRNTITVNEMVPFDSLPKAPQITLGDNYLVSVENDTTKSMNIKLKLYDGPSTAILYVNVQTKEPHFIVQVLNTSDKVIQSVVDQKSITFRYLPPEPIKIRAIIDKNGNGIWDPAIYPENREAEKIIYYQNREKKYETPIRSNWEVGPFTLKF